jgi:hypothetical protein
MVLENAYPLTHKLPEPTFGHASITTTGRYLHVRRNDSSSRFLRYKRLARNPHASRRKTSASQMNDRAVYRKSLVGGQQDELFDLRLRDQHPVKRIAMAPRKQGHLPRL